MGISTKVKQYLDDSGVDYQIRKHAHTGSTLESAYSAHVPASQIAKGVLLKDEKGYVLAVLPAGNDLNIETVRYQSDRPLELATEEELGDVFIDCSLGAVPAIGNAYALETVVDEGLLRESGLYFEAGDHEELVYVDEPEFEKLMEGNRYQQLSRTSF